MTSAITIVLVDGDSLSPASSNQLALWHCSDRYYIYAATNNPHVVNKLKLLVNRVELVEPKPDEADKAICDFLSSSKTLNLGNITKVIAFSNDNKLKTSIKAISDVLSLTSYYFDDKVSLLKEIESKGSIFRGLDQNLAVIGGNRTLADQFSFLPEQKVARKTIINPLSELSIDLSSLISATYRQTKAKITVLRSASHNAFIVEDALTSDKFIGLNDALIPVEFKGDPVSQDEIANSCLKEIIKYPQISITLNRDPLSDSLVIGHISADNKQELRFGNIISKLTVYALRLLITRIYDGSAVLLSEASFSTQYLQCFEFDEYRHKLYKTLAPREIAHVNLDLDKGIFSRLSHYKYISEIKKGDVIESFKRFYVVDEVLAVEGLTPEKKDFCSEDVDLVIKTADEVVYLDATSNPDLLLGKHWTMSNRFSPHIGTSCIYKPFFSINYDVYIRNRSSMLPDTFLLSTSWLNCSERERERLSSKIEEFYDKALNEVINSPVRRVAPLTFKEIMPDEIVVDEFLRSNNPNSVSKAIEALYQADVNQDFTRGIKSLISKFNSSKEKDIFLVQSASLGALAHPFITPLIDIKGTDKTLFIKDSGITEVQETYRFGKEQQEYVSGIGVFKHVKDHVYIAHVGQSLSSKAMDQILGVMRSSADNIQQKRSLFEVLRDHEAEVFQLKNKVIETSPLFSKIKAISKSTTYLTGNSKWESLLNGLEALSETEVFQRIEHQYEICKTVLSSIRTSPKENHYYLGKNGAYNSYTLVKSNSTTDSFTTTHYIVFYHTNNAWVKTKWFTLNKNSVVWLTKLPFVVLSTAAWYLENTDYNRDNVRQVTSALVELALLSSINRDPFAQVSELYRYFLMGAVGLNEEFSKIFDKMNFYSPKSKIELVYLVRMLKTSFYLKYLQKKGAFDKVLLNGQITIVHPHDRLPNASFSYLVSSLYICNIYDKYRAFHEVSEAICYLDLQEEERIYQGRKIDLDAINKKYTVSAFYDTDSLIKDWKLFLEMPQDRFMGFPPFIFAASFKHRPKVKHVVPKLPLDELFSLRGATSGGKLTKEDQGIRAASSVLESMLTELGLSVTKAGPETMYMANDSLKGHHAVSVMNMAILILRNPTTRFLYRIVQKDQKGNREISVLNAAMRICTAYLEHYHKHLSSSLGPNLLSDSAKDIKFSEAVAHLHKHGKGLIVYDNSDQSRWGPNAVMEFFSVFTAGFVQDDEFLYNTIKILNLMKTKTAKYPESLIRLHEKGFVFSKGVVAEFFKKNGNSIKAGKYGETFEWGMCQGILHELSSNYHAIAALVHQDIAQKTRGVSHYSKFVTSDDAFSQAVYSSATHYHTQIYYEQLVNKAMNIIRNTKKSTGSVAIGEFNSIFISKKTLALPTLKFRVAKIDCGNGVDYFSDALSACASASSVLSSGCSYVGSCLIGVLNLTLTCDQWAKFQDYKIWSQLPVEYGGLPKIEPVSVSMNGPLSSCFLRAQEYCGVSIEDYSKAVSSALIDEDELKLIPKNRIADSKEGILTMLVPSLVGIYSNTRTPKKASKLALRHKLHDWTIHDFNFKIFKEANSVATNVISFYEFYRNAPFDLDLRENSFYKRFTEPWVSKDRKCLSLSPKGEEYYPGLKSPFSLSDLTNFQKGLVPSAVLTLYRGKAVRAKILPQVADIMRYLTSAQNSLGDLISKISSAKVFDAIIDPNCSIIKLSLASSEIVAPSSLRHLIFESLVGTSRAKKVPGFEKYDEVTFENTDKPLIEAWIQAGNASNKLFNAVDTTRKTITYSKGNDRSLASHVEGILRYKFTDRFGCSGFHVNMTETMRVLNLNFQPNLKALSDKILKYNTTVFQSVISGSKTITGPLAITAKEIDAIRQTYTQRTLNDQSMLGTYRANSSNLSSFASICAATKATFNTNISLFNTISGNTLLMNRWLNTSKYSAVKVNPSYITVMLSSTNVNLVVTEIQQNIKGYITHVFCPLPIILPPALLVKYSNEPIIRAIKACNNKDLGRATIDLDTVVLHDTSVSKVASFSYARNSCMILLTDARESFHIPVATYSAEQVEIQNIEVGKDAELNVHFKDQDLYKALLNDVALLKSVTKLISIYSVLDKQMFTSQVNAMFKSRSLPFSFYSTAECNVLIFCVLGLTSDIFKGHIKSKTSVYINLMRKSCSYDLNLTEDELVYLAPSLTETKLEYDEKGDPPPENVSVQASMSAAAAHSMDDFLRFEEEIDFDDDYVPEMENVLNAEDADFEDKLMNAADGNLETKGEALTWTDFEEIIKVSEVKSVQTKFTLKEQVRFQTAVAYSEKVKAIIWDCLRPQHSNLFADIASKALFDKLTPVVRLIMMKVGYDIQPECLLFLFSKRN